MREVAPEADAPEEEADTADAWHTRMRRRLNAGTAAAWTASKHKFAFTATAAIDSLVAALGQLRLRTSGASPQDDEDNDGSRGRGGRRTGARPPRREAGADTPPRPRRRLRGALVYVCVLLAGSMGGTVVAFALFEHLLAQRATLIERQDVQLAKKAKSLLTLRKALERQAAQREENDRKLEEMEKKLAASEDRLAQLQLKRDEAQSQLASARAAAVRQAAAAAGNRGQSAGRAVSSWSGECTVGGGDVRAVLDGCIAGLQQN